MVNIVDVLVIGTGTAGYTLAPALSKAGRKVAVVDTAHFTAYAIALQHGAVCGSSP